MHAPTILAGLSDDELVVLAQENDDAAFGELMRRTLPTSTRLAVSILRDRDQAEDELQNSYLKAWRHVDQFQRESRFSTWISRIVMNQCLMRLRTLRRASFVYLDDVAADGKIPCPEVTDPCWTPEDRCGAHELSVVLQREIRRLPRILREVLVLRDVKELSTDEAASCLRITGAAVKTRLLRARLELRKRLEKCCGPADGQRFLKTTWKGNLYCT
jgi:RNA polymerase sigma-70 factor (ECF subfamily)